MNYFNSLIQKRTGICLDCRDDVDRYLTAGRCDMHYSIYRKKIILDKQREKSKVRSLINSPANKSLLEKNNKIVSSEMTLYYSLRMNEVEPVCDNCGVRADWIKEYYKLWKAAQAHILPKKNFKSIQIHPLNFLTLFAGYSGVCSCHDILDSNWDAASKMKIWPIVIERFQILYSLITSDEHKFIPQILLDTL